MNKYVAMIVINIIALSMAAVFVFSMEKGEKYIENLELGGLSKGELKVAEQEYRKRRYSPDYTGRVDEYKKEKFERQYLNLTNTDIGDYFKKDVPLDQSNISYTYLMTWLSLAATDIMDFGFIDYKARFALTSNYFTDHGWESFARALERSRMIEMVEVNQQIITAAPSGAPMLQSEGIRDGVYQWVIELPLMLTYRSGAKTANTELLVTFVVKRSNAENHPYGIAIDQWIALAR